MRGETKIEIPSAEPRYFLYPFFLRLDWIDRVLKGREKRFICIEKDLIIKIFQYLPREKERDHAETSGHHKIT
jgi:hypothetical protein